MNIAVRLACVWFVAAAALGGCAQVRPNVIHFKQNGVDASLNDTRAANAIRNGADIVLLNATTILVDYSSLSTSHFHFTGNPPAPTDPLFLNWEGGVQPGNDPTIVGMLVNTSPNLPMATVSNAGQLHMTVSLSGGRRGRYFADGSGGTYFEIRLDQADIPNKRIGCVIQALAKRDPSDNNIHAGDPDRLALMEAVFLVDHD